MGTYKNPDFIMRHCEIFPAPYIRFRTGFSP